MQRKKKKTPARAASSDPAPVQEVMGASDKMQELCGVEFVRLVQSALSSLPDAVKKEPRLADLKTLIEGINELLSTSLEEAFPSATPTVRKKLKAGLNRYILSGGIHNLEYDVGNGRRMTVEEKLSSDLKKRVKQTWTDVADVVDEIEKEDDGGLLLLKAKCLLVALPQIAPLGGSTMKFKDTNLSHELRVEAKEHPELKAAVPVARRIVCGEVWGFVLRMRGLFGDCEWMRDVSAVPGWSTMRSDMGTALSHDDADKETPPLIPKTATGLEVSLLKTLLKAASCDCG